MEDTHVVRDTDGHEWSVTHDRPAPCVERLATGWCPG